MPPSLPVGSDIEAYCGSCKETLWHVVFAKEADKIVKVVCKRCQQQHRYKDPSAPAKVRSTTPRATRAAKVAEPSVEVDLSRPPRVYSPRDDYRAGDRVTHPSFGTGVVEGSPGPGKVTIFFPAGRKVLVVGRA
jgi:hypothetical protein